MRRWRTPLALSGVLLLAQLLHRPALHDVASGLPPSMAALKHPLVGDAAYGAQTPGERPFLHALSLSFTHPRTGKELTFSAPLPADFRAALKARGWTGTPIKR